MLFTQIYGPQAASAYTDIACNQNKSILALQSSACRQRRSIRRHFTAASNCCSPVCVKAASSSASADDGSDDLPSGSDSRADAVDHASGDVQGQHPSEHGTEVSQERIIANGSVFASTEIITGPEAAAPPDAISTTSQYEQNLMRGELSDASPGSSLSASMSDTTLDGMTVEPSLPARSAGSKTEIEDAIRMASRDVDEFTAIAHDDARSIDELSAKEGAGKQTSRAARRRRPAFLDTMADVEASQNAILASTTGEDNDPIMITQSADNGAAAGSAASTDRAPSAAASISSTPKAPASSLGTPSVDWDEITAQVAPANSAEYIREARASTRRTKGMFQSTSRLRNWLSEQFGRISYGYYCWRKDSVSDLLIILALNLVVLLVGATFKMLVIDGGIVSVPAFWAAVYNILDVVFGQDLPEPDAPFIAQAFGVVVAGIGLASFALVLALVEQIVLENIDSNVKTGSSVYESGHMLVLVWAYNSKDLEVVWKVLSQACLAYRADGGRVITVLSSREKLEMEAMFRRTIPEEARYGSTFVFRQGNPLVPDDLRAVAASAAAQVCVVSDTSRYPSEADAQSLRAAVLLDELDFPGVGVPDPRTGIVVVELKTANAVPLLRYSCSRRIIGLATSQLNARRVARILKSPVVGLLSNVWGFNFQSQTYLEHVPQFVGRTFGSIARQLPDAIPFGITNPFSGMCKINPPSGMFVNEGDQIVMLRPTSINKDGYVPASAPVDLPPVAWDHSSYVCAEFDFDAFEQRQQHSKPRLIPPLMSDTATSSSAGQIRDRPTSMEYLKPLEYTHLSGEPERLLVCGWSEPTFMSNLLRELDHGPAALPRGSEVVMFNSLDTLQQQDTLSDFPKLRNIKLLHIRGNPLNRKELDRKIDIESYHAAVILCDMAWLDPDLRVANGIAIADQGDMLRLDAMLMTVQLNLRKMLEDADRPNFNCIVEKCGFEGVTRFEDGFRLPLGIPVNFPSHAASILLEVAFNPKVLLPFSHLGEDDELRVQDASCLCDEGDHVTFWELQRRAQTVGQVLLGWLEVPPTLDQPLSIVINPVGNAMRSEARIWNSGNQRLKLVTFSQKDEPRESGLRSRFARFAMQESNGARMQSVTHQPPLRYTSTITEELLEAAALNLSSRLSEAGNTATARFIPGSRIPDDRDEEPLVVATTALPSDEGERPFVDV